MRAKLLVSLLAMVLVLTLSCPLFAAKLKIVNGDAPGEGFNDPTPATPVGGNKGKTVGEQRQIAFEFAANIWGATLPVSGDFQIRVFSRFDPLTCTATSAVLGSAGPITVFSDFPGATFPATWYTSAEANRLAGFDLFPGPKVVPGVPPTSINARIFDDISARFNSSIGFGVNPDGSPCLPGTFWYYGLNTNTPPGGINLVAVLLHEFGHGLGFLSLVDISPTVPNPTPGGPPLPNPNHGAELLGMDDIYSKMIRDNTIGKTWDIMTNAERATSSINTGNVVWVGPNAVGAVPSVLGGVPQVVLNVPALGALATGQAGFGAPVIAPGVTDNVVLALDPAVVGSPSPTDGCSPLTNAAAVAGNIALIDRGTCGFIVKAKNAQNAGAVGIIIANNVAGAPPGLGGCDGTITIPVASVSLADGTTIKANLPGVNATIGASATISGTDGAGNPRLFAPSPVQLGSSISHWDSVAYPNQLMEPAINCNLTHSVVPPQDLTFELLLDLGW